MVKLEHYLVHLYIEWNVDCWRVAPGKYGGDQAAGCRTISTHNKLYEYAYKIFRPIINMK